MDSLKRWQVRVFDVDGINLDDKPFVIKNEIMFSSRRATDDIKNIANAHVVLKRPFPMKEELFIESNVKDIGEALEKLSIFLTCYHISTNNEMPQIYTRGSSGYSLDQNDKLEKIISSYSSILPKSDIRILQPNQMRESLEKTIPLYEKVDQILNSTNSETSNSLKTSLIVYQRSAAAKFDYINGILGFITAMEALFTNPEDIKYKFSLRVTLAITNSLSSRRELFDFLNNAYRLRNKLVHGVEIDLGAIVDNMSTYVRLMKIARIALLKFIEFISINKTKKDWIDHLDNTALGIEKSF